MMSVSSKIVIADPSMSPPRIMNAAAASKAIPPPIRKALAPSRRAGRLNVEYAAPPGLMIIAKFSILPWRNLQRSGAMQCEPPVTALAAPRTASGSTY
jgi:hypothetical protein